MIAYVIVAVVLALLVAVALSVRILKQYERAVMFHLGKVRDGARGPGLIVFVPFVNVVHRVSLRIVTMPIQSQGIITRDNVSVDVSAVAYYRVADPVRSVVAIEDVEVAINQIAQTTLRAVVGRHTLDETLSETDKINGNIREILDVQTEEWGIKVTTVKQWSRTLPQNFLTTAVTELDGTSPTAEYGPPYNHNSDGQHAWVLEPQKWLGVSHPIDTARDFVISPLESVPDDPPLQSALARYKDTSGRQQKAWGEAYAKPLEASATAAEEDKPAPTTVSVNQSTGTVAVRPAGHAGPVPVMMSSLLALAKSGGVDGSLLTSKQFFQTDYTKPLLFMADGGLLEKRAEEQDLLGEQWGLMNETGSYPGQAWLWLYALWYQVEPIKASANADILVLLIMGVLSLALVLVPFIPGLRDLPRRIPIYRLIWREHYRSSQPRSAS